MNGMEVVQMEQVDLHLGLFTAWLFIWPVPVSSLFSRVTLLAVLWSVTGTMGIVSSVTFFVSRITSNVSEVCSPAFSFVLLRTGQYGVQAARIMNGH